MTPRYLILCQLVLISLLSTGQENNTENYLAGSGAQISTATDKVRGTRFGAVLISEQQIKKKSSYFIIGSLVLPKKYSFATPISTEKSSGEYSTTLYQADLTNMYFTLGLGYKQYITGDFKEKDGVYLATSLGVAVSVDKLEINYSDGYFSSYEYNAMNDLYENTAAILLAAELGIGYSKKVNGLDIFSELKYQYISDPSRDSNPYVPTGHEDPFKYFDIKNQRISNSYAFVVGIKYSFN